MALVAHFRLRVETFFVNNPRKVFKASTLSVRYPGCCLQSIVKERLTRKVFWNIDLVGPDCRPGLDVSCGMILRCECARVHCALFTARVKVIRHMEGEWGCGKAEFGAGLEEKNRGTSRLSLHFQWRVGKPERSNASLVTAGFKRTDTCGSSSSARR
jgi:hypothetical protein